MSSLNAIKTKLPPLRSPLVVTSARSTTLPQVAIANLQHQRDLATNIAESLNPNKLPEKPSPITQACYKLPENKALSTFLYHKLPASQIPTGWSNSPVDLEVALGLHSYFGKAYDSNLRVSMPIAVKLVDRPAHKETSVYEYLFEAGGCHYLFYGPFYHLPYGILYRITKAEGLASILQIMRTEGKGALEKVMLEKPLRQNLTELKYKVVGETSKSGVERSSASK